MNSTVVFITAAVAVPVIALAGWIWVVVARVDREFCAELQGMHFDL